MKSSLFISSVTYEDQTRVEKLKLQQKKGQYEQRGNSPLLFLGDYYSNISSFYGYFGLSTKILNPRSYISFVTTF